MTSQHPTALITGASRGFGRALATSLAERGWRLVLDARDANPLTDVERALPRAVAVPGDVTDAVHREALAAAIDVLGGIDLLVHNASELGPSPLPELADYPMDALRRVYETNVFAPLALTQLLLPALSAANGTVVAISSDAAVETYQTWGGYGSSKAALDQLMRVLGAENESVRATGAVGAERASVRVYSFDPGDMRTEMHQRAFPGDDISDRPQPESVVPALLHLLDRRPASGRYRAAELTGLTELPRAVAAP